MIKDPESVQAVFAIVISIIIAVWFINRVITPRRSIIYKKIRAKGLKALHAMTWQDFEHFCGGWFEKRGYRVKMCGLGGADGGIDLIVRKRRKVSLVQCKHWKARVGVSTVREMYGIMTAERFDGVYIVSLNGFTKDAKKWASGKPITLVSDTELLS